MDEEHECTVRLCQRHRPTPAKPRKKPRYGYGQREAEPAQSEDGALFCGECDGDLPGGCPEQYRMDCLDRRAALCDVHVSHLKVSSLSSRVQTFYSRGNW